MKQFVAALFVLLGLISADARPRGIQAIDTSIFTPSQRTLYSENFVDNVYSYQFIDHVMLGGPNGIGPAGSGSFASPTYFFASGNPTWNSASGAAPDAAGWPTNFAVVDPNLGANGFGNHVLLPNSANYGAAAGAYTIEWTGDCQLSLILGTWSGETVVSNPSGNYVRNSNGNWTGTSIKLTVSYTGVQQQVGWRILRTGHLTGSYCRGLHIYRTPDAADFAAGKIFRSAYKQYIVDQVPSAIRTMNWHGANNSLATRWENRAPFAAAMYGSGYPQVSLPYGETSGANTMTLAGVTGTPVSMQHGEIAFARIGASMTNSVDGGRTVSAIQKCNPAVLCLGGQVTATAHGFTTGDPAVFLTPTTGMTQLNYYQTTVTVIDADHFDTTIDTTLFSTFTTGSVQTYVSLQVGSGSDRVGYPVTETQTSNPIAKQGSVNFLHANDYRTFYFDKTVYASRDGSGNPRVGVWKMQSASDGGVPMFGTPQLDAPIELSATLVKEVNEMSPTKPIGLWMNIPCPALMSADPDYTADSSYTYKPIQAALAILNSTTRIFVEYCNETWNGPSATFTQYQYLIQRALARTSVLAGNTSIGFMSALRSVNLVTDAKAVLGSHPRVHYVMAGQGAGGITIASTNFFRSFGNTASILYYADPFVMSLPRTSCGTGNTNGTTTVSGFASTAAFKQYMGIYGANITDGTYVTAIAANSITLSQAATGTATGTAFTCAPTPISYHFAFAFGTYFDPPTDASYFTLSGVGGYNDDRAMYHGTDASGAVQFTASIAGAANASTLTVTAVAAGTILPMQVISDGAVNVNITTTVISQLTGTGGAACPDVTCTNTTGTYRVTAYQANTSSGVATPMVAQTVSSQAMTSLNSSGNNYIGAANAAQARTNFVEQVKTGGGNGQTTANFLAAGAAFHAVFAPLGVYTISYEGGHEWNGQLGARYARTINAADSAFFIDIQGSAEWSTALQAFLTSYRAIGNMIAMPSVYNLVGSQWGFTSVNNASAFPDTYLGTVGNAEGSALSQVWTDNGVVNQSLP